ncbi:MAG: flavin reductase family protein [Pseudomonadota bacterium]
MPDSSAQPATDAPAVDPLALRKALGQFATGVCIVASPPVADEAQPFAITVNSFASVSLDPPMVLWSVQKDSTTYALWLETRQFGISVLAADQAALCDQFAVRGNHAMTDPDAYVLSGNGSPLVRGAVATFDCRVNAIHDAGDHKLILADVLAFASDASREPLIYVRGGVHGSS